MAKEDKDLSAQAAAAAAPPEEQPQAAGVDLKAYLDGVMPDNGFTTDEERVAALVERDQKNEEANHRLLSFFEENPEFGHLVSQVTMKKRAPQAVFAELFEDGDTYQKFLEEAADANDEDSVQKMYEARKAKKTEQAQLAAEMEKRQADFGSTIEAWAKKKKLSPEQEQKFKDTLSAFFTMLADLKVTDKELDMLHKITTYDDDMEAALVKGRNEQISAIEDKEKANAGDGTPGLGSRAVKPEDNSRKQFLDKWL